MEIQTCTVPMNFGSHLLELKGLNDLQLMCRGGDIVRTSSFPLAINSLVMSDLVGKQHMKELDLEEFSRSSVQCFVESCYTGVIAVNRDNFREINKLSAVFQVEWMVNECLKYYTDLCSELKTASMELGMFLWEEAAYYLKERNNRSLQDALKIRLERLSNLRLALVKEFISRDPNQQEYVNTDMCLSQASSNEVTFLYDWLIENFEGKLHPVKLTDVEKRFLTSSSLALCFQTDQALYQRLLATVQRSITKEDLVSRFESFASVPFSLSTTSNPSSSLNPPDTIVYPIEIPALNISGCR
eukprot:sb/3467373/